MDHGRFKRRKVESDTLSDIKLRYQQDHLYQLVDGKHGICFELLHDVCNAFGHDFGWDVYCGCRR